MDIYQHICTCEPVSGLLAREETPPSKQASESAMISRRRRATEQKRYSVRTKHHDGLDGLSMN